MKITKGNNKIRQTGVPAEPPKKSQVKKAKLSKTQQLAQTQQTRETKLEQGIKVAEQGDTALSKKLQAGAEQGRTATSGGIKGAGTGLAFFDMHKALNDKLQPVYGDETPQIDMRSTEQGKQLLDLLDQAKGPDELRWMVSSLLESDRLVPGHGISTEEGKIFFGQVQRFRDKWKSSAFDKDLKAMVRTGVDHKLALRALDAKLDSGEIKFTRDSELAQFKAILDGTRTSDEVQRLEQCLGIANELGQTMPLTIEEAGLVFAQVEAYRAKFGLAVFDKDLNAMMRGAVDHKLALRALDAKLESGEIKFGRDADLAQFKAIVAETHKHSEVQRLEQCLDIANELGKTSPISSEEAGVVFAQVGAYRQKFPNAAIDGDLNTMVRSVVDHKLALRSVETKLKTGAIKFTRKQELKQFKALLGTTHKAGEVQVFERCLEIANELGKTMPLSIEESKIFFDQVQAYRTKFPTAAFDADLSAMVRRVVESEQSKRALDAKLDIGEIKFTQSEPQRQFEAVLKATTDPGEVLVLERCLEIANELGKTRSTTGEEAQVVLDAISAYRNKFASHKFDGDLTAMVRRTVDHTLATREITARLDSGALKFTRDAELAQFKDILENTITANEINVLDRCLEITNELGKTMPLTIEEAGVLFDSVAAYRKKFNNHVLDGDLTGMVRKRVDLKLGLRELDTKLDTGALKFTRDSELAQFRELLGQVNSASELQVIERCVDIANELGKTMPLTIEEAGLLFGKVAEYRNKFGKMPLDGDLTGMVRGAVDHKLAQRSLRSDVENGTIKLGSASTQQALFDVLDSATLCEGDVQRLRWALEQAAGGPGKTLSKTEWSKVADAVEYFRGRWPALRFDGDFNNRVKANLS